MQNENKHVPRDEYIKQHGITMLSIRGNMIHLYDKEMLGYNLSCELMDYQVIHLYVLQCIMETQNDQLHKNIEIHYDNQEDLRNNIDKIKTKLGDHKFNLILKYIQLLYHNKRIVSRVSHVINQFDENEQPIVKQTKRCKFEKNC